MAEITYWRLMIVNEDGSVGSDYIDNQFTMLYSGNMVADLRTLDYEANQADCNPVFELWKSKPCGNRKHDDGTDMFRTHVKVLDVTRPSSPDFSNFLAEEL